MNIDTKIGSASENSCHKIHCRARESLPIYMRWAHRNEKQDLHTTMLVIATNTRMKVMYAFVLVKSDPELNVVEESPPLRIAAISTP